MPPPSKLAIAASSLTRLLKEEASYHKEQAQQEARIKTLEQTTSGDNENAEFQLKQERKALEETKAVFPSVRKRIEDATAQLEQRLAADGASSSEEDVGKAQAALQEAKSSS